MLCTCICDADWLHMLSDTVVQWVAFLPENTEGVASNPGTGTYVVAGITT